MQEVLKTWSYEIWCALSQIMTLLFRNHMILCKILQFYKPKFLYIHFFSVFKCYHFYFLKTTWNYNLLAFLILCNLLDLQAALNQSCWPLISSHFSPSYTWHLSKQRKITFFFKEHWLWCGQWRESRETRIVQGD